MQPLVIEYLKKHTLQQLEDEHGVNSRPSADFTKLSLSYDQINARSGDPLSEQCRGLIVRPIMQHLDAEILKKTYLPNLEVVAWPMNRFYNEGDFNAAQVDWTDTQLQVCEKVDGTCIIVYWDPLHMKWHAATRSVPEADLPISSNDLEIGDMTFSQLFLKALIATREEISGKPVDWYVDGPDKVIHLNKEVTYVFELASRHNQIVVDYPEPRVYLLAARHTASGIELPVENVRIEHVRRPKTWPIANVTALKAFVDTMNPSEFEGAVVRDSNFRRIKVKSPAYVLAHRSKDSITASPRNALEAVILEKVDDIISLIPATVGEKITKMQHAYGQFCKGIDANVATFKQEAAGSRKRFAEQVMLSGDWAAPYFSLWEGRAPSAHEWIQGACKLGKLSPTMLDVIIARLSK